MNTSCECQGEHQSEYWFRDDAKGMEVSQLSNGVILQREWYISGPLAGKTRLNTQPLLTPVRMGDLDLRNRIVMAPLTRMRADNPGSCADRASRPLLRATRLGGLDR